MIPGHIIGIPIEESVLALVPAGGAIMTAISALLGRRLRRSRRAPTTEVR